MPRAAPTKCSGRLQPAERSASTFIGSLNPRYVPELMPIRASIVGLNSGIVMGALMLSLRQNVACAHCGTGFSLSATADLGYRPTCPRVEPKPLRFAERP